VRLGAEIFYEGAAKVRLGAELFYDGSWNISWGN